MATTHECSLECSHLAGETDATTSHDDGTRDDAFRLHDVAPERSFSSTDSSREDGIILRGVDPRVDPRVDPKGC